MRLEKTNPTAGNPFNNLELHVQTQPGRVVEKTNPRPDWVCFKKTLSELSDVFGVFRDVKEPGAGIESPSPIPL